jgi:Ran GTPase-activating protein (RanGAP) involved in mRNA processing and transport
VTQMSSNPVTSSSCRRHYLDSVPPDKLRSMTFELFASIDSAVVQDLDLQSVLFPEQAGSNSFRLVSDGRRLPALLDLLTHPGLRNLPIDTLVLTRGATPKNLPQIVAHPGLSRIRCLRLIDQRIGDEGFSLLCRSLPWLESLDLFTVGITGAGMAALAKSQLRLKSLQLCGNKLGTDGARAIVGSASAETLEILRLDNCKIDATAIEILAQQGRLTSLRRLHLGHAKLGSKAVSIIANGPWTRLEMLDLSYDRIAPPDLSAIFSRTLGESLTAICLDDTNTDDACLESVAQACPRRLTSLVMRHAHVKGTGVMALVAAAPGLQELMLSTNVEKVAGAPLGDEIMQALVAHCPDLRVLDLDMWVTDAGLSTLSLSNLRQLRELRLYGHIGEAGVAALASSEVMRSIEVLEFYGQPCGEINDNAARALAQSRFVGNLNKLSLRGQRIGSDGLAALMGSETLVIEDLDLYECKVQVAGIQALCSSPNAARLRDLDLSFNAIGDAGSEMLANCTALSALKKLGLSGCKLTAKGVQVLRESTVLQKANVCLAYNEGT